MSVVRAQDEGQKGCWSCDRTSRGQISIVRGHADQSTGRVTMSHDIHTNTRGAPEGSVAQSVYRGLSDLPQITQSIHIVDIAMWRLVMDPV